MKVNLNLYDNNLEFWEVWNNFPYPPESSRGRSWLKNHGCDVISDDTNCLESIEFLSENHYLAFKLKYI